MSISKTNGETDFLEMTELEKIVEHKIVSIIRGYAVSQTLEIVNALYDGGVRLVEVTLNSPNVLESISKISAMNKEGLLVGAGTVLNVGQTRAAVDAGARFIISPGTDIETIEKTKELGIVSIPGAFTPTEVITASNAGADVIKIFPSVLGPGYIKDLRGPLDDVKLMPTGGVTVENIPVYLNAGAVAFGIGSSLLKSENQGEAKLEDIRQNAADFVKAVEDHV